MPLTATLDGELVEAFLATDDDWLNLRKTHKSRRLLMSCGQTGIPRTSKLGLRHFAHKAGMACDEPRCWQESAQHMAAKSIIARAASEAGWQVTVECATTDRSWIADVMAEKDGRRIALEVQWSRQDAEEFTRRQERYKAAGIECFWFVHRRNGKNAEASGVPHVVFDGDGAPYAVFSKRAFEPLAPIDLPVVVAAVLGDSYLNRIEARTTSFLLESVVMLCWKCHEPSIIWRIGGVKLATRCRQVAEFVRDGQTLWGMRRLEEGVLDDVARLLEPLGVPPMSPLRVHASRTAKSSYLAYGCAHCPGGFFGDWYIYNEKNWTRIWVPTAVQIPIEQDILQVTHVCGEGPDRCNQDAAALEGPVFEGHQETWEEEESEYPGDLEEEEIAPPESGLDSPLAPEEDEFPAVSPRWIHPTSRGRSWGPVGRCSYFES